MTEYRTTPLHRQSLLEELAFVSGKLAQAGIQVAQVSFGWDCNLPFDELWQEHDVKVDGILEFVHQAEQRGTVEVGKGDVFVKMPGFWRLAPQEILRWCNREDPDGATERQEKFAVWSTRHAVLRSQIAQRFDELVPLVPLGASTGSVAVELARARIIVEIDRSSFLGKSHDETVSYCRQYAGDAFWTWDSKRLESVERSLEALNAWARQRGEPQATQ